VIKLYYQRRVNNRGETLGADALIRWQDAERDTVLPGEFIALAEESGLIVPIGRWVVESACQTLKRWEASYQTDKLKLSVNVSPRQFADESFVPQLVEIVCRSGISPALLELEITEGLLLSDIEDAVGKMRALRRLGVSFALDDSGTGYSSLSYLQKLPLQSLKIDRSFVRELGTGSGGEAIVKAIVQVGQSLNLGVIAEGVETEQQWASLARMDVASTRDICSAIPFPSRPSSGNWPKTWLGLDPKLLRIPGSTRQGPCHLSRISEPLLFRLPLETARIRCRWRSGPSRGCPSLDVPCEALRCYDYNPPDCLFAFPLRQ
jgi:EAL domain-containing protein (putative c-di-GMP-specific phosphodiesterase class I)